jgi:hypothetical protein
MSAEIVPFNPLDKTNLGASVADALLERPAIPLAELSEFRGAGVYALYYTGGFKPYRATAKLNAGGAYRTPIYVGKAVPAGSRKGGVLDMKPGRVLFSRLSEHAESIRAATNLKVDDFACRFLVVDDIWIPLGESLLIARFAPLWNSLIDGFGNHDPGSGRHAGMRPRWDVLHPGRAWAKKCKERKESASDIEREIANHLSNAID